MRVDTAFSPSFGNRPSQLVGREATILTLERALDSARGSRERSIIVLGQRGSGKTVLLWEVADLARSRGFVVATPTVPAEGALERIVEKLQDDGERYAREGERLRLTGGSVGALGFSAGLQFTRDVEESKSAQYKLTQLCRKLSGQGHGTLILVDELQANSVAIRQLVVTYQELVGEGLDVALVMAGLPSAVSATLNDHVLTFLNRALKIELPPLAEGDVDAYFMKAFDNLGIAIPPELRRRAACETHGSPYLMQLVGHNIATYADGAGAVDEATLSEAIESAQATFGNDICKTTLAALSDRDVDFLAAMAADFGPSNISSVAERMGVSFDYAQKYRKRLIDAGVIARARRGYVEFAIPLLGDYLRREALD